MQHDELQCLISDLRTSPIRELDQIHMKIPDLIEQARRTASLMTGKQVLFVGDNDLASVATVACCDSKSLPASVTLVDFDERVLSAVAEGFDRLGLRSLLHADLYNVFDSPPQDLVGRHNLFYTNPPYGRHNGGASICLFVQRGLAMCTPFASSGIVIMPSSTERQWTASVNRNVIDFAEAVGWKVVSESPNSHHYELDDDPTLSSRSYLFTGCLQETHSIKMLTAETIVEYPPHFYGRSVKPPYPDYVNSSGVLVYNSNSLRRAS